jgi:hypothetical protein
MGIEPTSEAWEGSQAKKDSADSASTVAGICARINLAMSALIFTGDLQEVLPGKLAVRGNRGERCAACKSCKALICKVLR